VTINLAVGTGSGGDATGDHITGFEAVIGSGYADTLTGGAAAASLYGGDGNDTLNGGSGADTLNGGAGTDTASYAGSTTGVTIDLATGTGSGGGATGDHFVSIEQVIGSAFNDSLAGSAGNDSLNGGAGNDILIGGLGGDLLTGGIGADRFVFNSLGPAPFTNPNSIWDFTGADGDKIDLSAIDANSHVAGNQAFTWIGYLSSLIGFSGSGGELGYFKDVPDAEKTTGYVMGDIDGDKVADFRIDVLFIKQLDGSDFVL